MGARGIFPAVGLAFAWFACWSPCALAQEAPVSAGTDLTPEILSVAKEQADNNGVPLGTALTDLVTKGASLRASSGLGTITGEPSSTVLSPLDPVVADARMRAQSLGRNSRSEYLDAEVAIDAPIAEVAMDRGYSPRTIELDSRFEENIARIASPRADPLPPHGRVVGGVRILEPDPFPEVVAIRGNHRICSGTLIAADKVLTAAHCHCGGVNQWVDIGQSTTSPIDTIRVDQAASEAFRPCDEIKSDLGRGDIAILKLARPATPPPRPLTSVPSLRAAASVRAVGFGRTDTHNAGFKYMVDIVIASYQCDGSALTGIPDSQVYNCVPGHELVAATLNRDTCGGDSGGPVFVLDTHNQLQIAGVTSRAVDPTGKCGPGGIYVIPAAPPVREWLEARGLTFP